MKVFQINEAQKGQFNELELPELAADKVRLAVKSVGICGSDIHYYFEGRCGDFEIRAPFICGHEASAEVVEHKVKNAAISLGQRVAINPGVACGTCRQCCANKSNLCEKMSFFGTASTWPHTAGVMREYVDVNPEQCFPLNDNVSYQEGACAEPLAVAIHAISRVDNIRCKNVAVMGAGPIGLLIASAAKVFGASKVVVADLQDKALAIASAMGVDEAVNVAAKAERLDEMAAEIGGFDIIFEATGSPQAFEFSIKGCRRGGSIIQVGGLPSGISSSVFNKIMANELSYLGSMRFTTQDYANAVSLINEKKINLSAMLTHSLEFDELESAFVIAKDKGQSSKVHVLLNQ